MVVEGRSKMNVKLISVLLLLSMVGCTQMPKDGNVAARNISNSAVEAANSTSASAELTAEILFDFTLGEIALQRNQLDVAVESFTRLAKITRDPRIAERATDIALRARRFEEAREAITLWVALEPDSIHARQAAVVLFVGAGQLNNARPHLEKLLFSEPESVDKAFMQLNKLLSRHDDKNEILKLVRQLANQHSKLPEAHFAVSQAAWTANQLELASDAMKQALKLRPDWEMAAIHQGRILQKIANAEAFTFYEQYLGKFPKANDMRIAYIRMLMEERDFNQSRKQFQKLELENPSNPDIALAIGLLSAELNDFNNAERYFKQALQLGFEDTSAVHFNLGRVNEVSQRYEEAMDSYRRVTGGDRYIPAQIRYAFLLAKQDGMKPARQHLQTVRFLDEAQHTQLVLSEAQLLREHNAYQEAFDLLNTHLKKNPDQAELLYDRALLADKIGEMDILERDLRRVIELKPDSAHAYNALGYSLAERGQRLPEALELIQKAIELSPDDPYIMDSLGWVYYRMGNLKKGLNYLNLAFAARPDPEIAAHLGELLWVKGAKEDAEKVWRSALEEYPSNEVLLDTMKRFMQ
jgi:tetratricopeptide (TPR) repeat protein